MANEFGNTIRKVRLKKGLTLKKLALLVGISATYLSLIERGKLNPPIDAKVKQLADLLEIDRDDLMYLAGRLALDVRDIVKSEPEIITKLARAVMPKELPE